jgi:ABC-2 type transport system ATP-binding protein
VMADGEVIASGSPGELINDLEGKIWRKIVAPEELREIESQHKVISNRLSAGQIVVHVLAETGIEGFVPCEVDLEDVYFSTLLSERTAEMTAR